ncbi:DOMON-like domain-containing protein [Hydrogenophaga sp.]|uniref:DOMON-like domain-containing protein n=1 Tax=Hydrogenophaga sp. TaxID=1904254 RepID=UPI00272F7BE8|nr:DOMON-like domain-containing protein [Hydrogenophaga sp.]MDP2015975.1 DOMON-like domain-containing protein [Hydrogenophaga sp.]
MTLPTISSTHALQCHPATPAGLQLSVSVVVGVASEGLRLVYTVSGNTTGLRIPPTTAPGSADGLWQHTCLEAFVAAEGDVAYREFNFSPSGQWAVYRFASERVRDTTTPDAVKLPTTHAVITPTQLTLTAHLPWSALPRHATTLCIALSAVIEEANGHLSYWALQHPRERPDFHHPAGRTLRLALPQN